MKLVRLLEFLGVRIAAAVMRGLPLPVARRLAAGAARRIFALGGKRVGYALANLRIAFPELSEEERREIGRESYVHFAWNLIDTVRAERWSDQEIHERIRVDGVEHLRAALAEDRGALLLVPHLGNFQIGGLALPLLGFPTAWVSRAMGNQRIERWLVRQRTRTGGELIRPRRALPQILRALRRGRAVAILNDQYSRRSRGVFVPFFGLRCSTTAGVATIAMRTRAPVLPVYIRRDAPDHHLITILSPLETEWSGDRKRDVETATTDYNHAYEKIIRRHPEQYMWATRRFRHSPDLAEEPYPSRARRSRR